MHIRHVAAGAVILHHGEAGIGLHLIAAGSVTVSPPASAGSATGVSELTVGQCFGEEALLDDRPQSVTVTAATNCTLYTLAKPDFLAARRVNRSLRDQLLTQLVVRGS